MATNGSLLRTLPRLEPSCLIPPVNGRRKASSYREQAVPATKSKDISVACNPRLASESFSNEATYIQSVPRLSTSRRLFLSSTASLLAAGLASSSIPALASDGPDSSACRLGESEPSSFAVPHDHEVDIEGLHQWAVPRETPTLCNSPASNAPEFESIRPLRQVPASESASQSPPLKPAPALLQEQRPATPADPLTLEMAGNLLSRVPSEVGMPALSYTALPLPTCAVVSTAALTSTVTSAAMVATPVSGAAVTAAATIATQGVQAIAAAPGVADVVGQSLRHFVGGSVAGAVGATVVYPLDTVKTRMQAQTEDEEGEPQYKNELDCLRQMVQNEGLTSLYSGLGPQLLGVAPEKAIKLTVNELLLQQLELSMPGTRVWALEFIAGGGGGFSQVLFTNPVEAVKVRMQTQQTHHAQPSHQPAHFSEQVPGRPGLDSERMGTHAAVQCGAGTAMQVAGVGHHQEETRKEDATADKQGIGLPPAADDGVCYTRLADLEGSRSVRASEVTSGSGSGSRSDPSSIDKAFHHISLLFRNQLALMSAQRQGLSHRATETPRLLQKAGSSKSQPHSSVANAKEDDHSSFAHSHSRSHPATQAAEEGSKPKTSMEVVRELGFRGLYHGAVVTLARDVPSTSLFFGLYTLLKTMYPDNSFMDGFIAAIPAAYIVTPMDVVKTRMQMEPVPGKPARTDAWECTKEILRQEGVRGLFRGGLVRVLRMSPQFGITLMLYDILAK